MTANDIIGCLVYRTAQRLNRDQKFIKGLTDHKFCPSLVNCGRLHLWHFPGTQQEISQVFQALSKGGIKGSKLKFPAIINFQGVLQEHGKETTTNRYNLAIISPVDQDWSTQQREEETYKRVLQPIEREFIRQVESCEFLHTPMGRFPYTSAYVPTTGKALNSIMKVQYGDYLDAIELPNFSIRVLDNECEARSSLIESESKKVTDEIKFIK